MGADSAADTLADSLVARNFFLVFDGSGSMREIGCSAGRPKIDVAKEAVVEWSRSVPQDANLGLFIFQNNQYVTLPLGAGNRERFVETINATQAGGKTPLTKAVGHAFAALTREGRRQLGYGEYTIVVVTDGIANSEQALTAKIGQILVDSPVTIYSIGFCIGRNHALNQPGQTIYKAADNPAALREGLRQVLAEAESFDETEFEDQ
jgi:uncharacterized protein with von Willebrand factor type A (vWA) domain